MIGNKCATWGQVQNPYVTINKLLKAYEIAGKITLRIQPLICDGTLHIRLLVTQLDRWRQ